MANEVKPKKNKNDVVYFTQKELADRWRVTQATIKNIRDKGSIPYFFPPNSSRVLYPRDEIMNIEQSELNLTRKEDCTLKKHTEFKMKKPVVSANSNKKWEI